jgi:tagatose-1,6-bisphosphate aldolase
MSKQFEIPERCLLSEAARYVLDQQVTLSDDTSSPVRLVPWSHELISALQLKKLGARADLFDAYYDEDNEDWEKNDLRKENVEVDAAFCYRATR